MEMMRIVSPGDLKIAIRRVQHALRRNEIVSLQEQDTCVSAIEILHWCGEYGREKKKHLEEYWDVLAWEEGDELHGGFFRCYYREIATGRVYVFFCETYHGGGGGLYKWDTRKTVWNRILKMFKQMPLKRWPDAT